MNRKEMDLLSDVAKLIHKYGPEAFVSLSAEIGNPKFTKALAEILTETANSYRTLPRPKRKSRTSVGKADLRTSLDQLEAERYALLIDFYDALKNHAVLPTLRDMKTFSADNGLPPIKAKSREQALIPFVRTFIKMPIEEVREHLRRIRPNAPPDDRTLEGWSNIIFGNEVAAGKN